MRDIIEVFGRLEGRAFLKCEGKYYEIRSVETKTTFEPGKEEKQIIVCYDAENQETLKFELKGYDLMRPFIEAVEAERETGCGQILLINMDTGEWRIYPITNDLKRKLPFLQDKKEYIV